jgi:hypothetical protein
MTKDIERIVHAYATAISSRKSLLSDVSELPYPKPVIKAALIVAIAVTKDAPMREQLKSGYVMLADWQEGVGSADAAKSSSFPDISAKMLAEGRALDDELRALGL